MHSLYYVIFNKENADTSEEARRYANSTLENENFAGGEGYWGGSKSDWYVIGGRWSGNLQTVQLKKDFYEEAKKQFAKENWGLTNVDIKDNKEEIQSVWEELGGTGTNPCDRDNYNHNGFDDDAQLLTPELLKALNKKEGDVEYFDADEYHEGFIKELTNDEIKDKWIVVVDYHH